MLEEMEAWDWNQGEEWRMKKESVRVWICEKHNIGSQKVNVNNLYLFKSMSSYIF